MVFNLSECLDDSQVFWIKHISQFISVRNSITSIVLLQIDWQLNEQTVTFDIDLGLNRFL